MHWYVQPHVFSRSGTDNFRMPLTALIRVAINHMLTLLTLIPTMHRVPTLARCSVVERLLAMSSQYRTARSRVLCPNSTKNANAASG